MTRARSSRDGILPHSSPHSTHACISAMDIRASREICRHMHSKAHAEIANVKWHEMAPGLTCLASRIPLILRPRTTCVCLTAGISGRRLQHFQVNSFFTYLPLIAHEQTQTVPRCHVIRQSRREHGETQFNLRATRHSASASLAWGEEPPAPPSPVTSRALLIAGLLQRRSRRHPASGDVTITTENPPPEKSTRA